MRIRPKDREEFQHIRLILPSGDVEEWMMRSPPREFHIPLLSKEPVSFVPGDALLPSAEPDYIVLKLDLELSKSAGFPVYI